MDPNAPIIIGLAGQAGSGKTVTAEGLAPIARSTFDDGMADVPIYWTHLFFALPIYRIVTARQKIHGDNSRNRILYEIHEAIVDLFGRTPLYSPIKNYDDLIALVRYVASIPCEPEGEKARSFMQEIGSLFREYDEDIFVKWIARKAQEEYREFRKEYPELTHPNLKCGVVVSDVRMLNEAEFISNHANGSLYKLTATPEVLARRLSDRDGKVLTPEQANHESEQSIKLIPNSLWTEVIETSDFSVAEQVDYVKKLIAQQYSILV